MRKKLLLIVCFAVSTLSVVAQHVTNVQARQEGKTIVVTYDLDRAARVGLKVIYENGGNQKESYWLYSSYYGYKSKNVSGDVDVVKAGKNKKIIWNVLEDYESYIHTNVRFEVVTTSPYSGIKTFIIPEYGYGFTPQHSFGLTFGQNYFLFGWYASVRSNFSLKKDDGLTCSYGGYIENPLDEEQLLNDELPFYSGMTKNNHITATVGGLWDLMGTFCYGDEDDHIMLALYVGVGYGQRYQLWETTDHQWITYGPTCYKGVCSDMGIIADFYRFTLLAGASTINFKYWELEVGLGLTIHHKYRIQKR